MAKVKTVQGGERMFSRPWKYWVKLTEIMNTSIINRNDITGAKPRRLDI